MQDPCAPNMRHLNETCLTEYLSSFIDILQFLYQTCNIILQRIFRHVSLYSPHSVHTGTSRGIGRDFLMEYTIVKFDYSTPGYTSLGDLTLLLRPPVSECSTTIAGPKKARLQTTRRL
jgi:hypothetical protein